MKFIHSIILGILLLLESNQSFATNNYQSLNYQISVFKDLSDTMSVTTVKNILSTNNKLFIQSGSFSEPFSAKGTYWLYVQPRKTYTIQENVLTFRSWVSLIEVYPYPFSTISSYGGRMISGRLKTISGCNVLLKPNINGYLLKVQNRLYSDVYAKDIEILPLYVFQKNKEKHDLVQGIVLGFLWLILIYNLLLYILIRKRIHLFYVIYIFLNSLFVLFTFSYSEIYLFPDNYKLNLILITCQLIGLFFYLMFLRMSLLSHCAKYTLSIDRKLILPYAWFMLAMNLGAASTILYRMDIFGMVSDITNLINCIVGIFIFIYFYKSADWFLRMIMTGSVILIIFGWISVLYAVFNINSDNIFYEIGLITELLLFTYALNKLHFEEKYKIELVKLQLESELEDKNRALVFQAMQLSAKDEAIASVKEKLKELGLYEKSDVHTITNSVLNNSINKNLWKEFEVHFNETHPGFYKALMEKYPELTQNELRLCAFLKLNLNTKEIAMITQKSPKSIEVMRSRIRQKMDLQRDANLIHSLSLLS